MKNQKNNPFRLTRYLMGAAKLSQLPPDEGIEIALAGRSNAGKSTALNAITDQKNLAKTSKTPGRTQLINLFTIKDNCRLTDLPGYGFAKVSKNIKENWQKTLSEYLQNRRCLQALVIFMDIRHPLKETDQQMINWAIHADIPVHVVLSKADKLKSGARKAALLSAQKTLSTISPMISCQAFSATQKIGLEQLIETIKNWSGFKDEREILQDLNTSKDNSSPDKKNSGAQ